MGRRSDDLSAWNQKILDVSQEGENVRVRLVQLSALDRDCPGLLVQAVEKVLPRTSAREVAGTNICAISPARAKRALAEASQRGVHFETASQTVVAECGRRRRQFDLPFDADLDFDRLKQSDPQVDELYRTIYSVTRRVFGDFWFQPGTPEQQEPRERLGLELIPALTSGKYDEVLGDFVQRLRAYKRTPIERRGLVPPSLVDADALHLRAFVAPVYPSIARSARVQGDVRLRITVDRQTGLVTKAEPAGGAGSAFSVVPLLAPAAVEAARQWEFDPAFLTGAPVDVTLRFSLTCRE